MIRIFLVLLIAFQAVSTTVAQGQPRSAPAAAHAALSSPCRSWTTRFGVMRSVFVRAKSNGNPQWKSYGASLVRYDRALLTRAADKGTPALSVQQTDLAGYVLAAYEARFNSLGRPESLLVHDGVTVATMNWEAVCLSPVVAPDIFYWAGVPTMSGPVDHPSVVAPSAQP